MFSFNHHCNKKVDSGRKNAPFLLALHTALCLSVKCQLIQESKKKLAMWSALNFSILPDMTLCFEVLDILLEKRRKNEKDDE